MMGVKDESEKVGLKLNIQKIKIMASGPITSWKIEGEKIKPAFLGSQMMLPVPDYTLRTVQVLVVVVTKSRLTLLQPHGQYTIRLLCLWDFLGKNIGVGCHFLLQGIFQTQSSKLCHLQCRWILYH